MISDIRSNVTADASIGAVVPNLECVCRCFCLCDDEISPRFLIKTDEQWWAFDFVVV